MSDSAKAVFLSYASQDVAAALRICTALRAAGVVPIDLTGLGGDADGVGGEPHQVRRAFKRVVGAVAPRLAA